MPAATGGYQPSSIVSASGTNAQQLKTSSGTLGPCTAFNLNASPRYLKFYDLARVPVPASDAPVYVVAMPGNATGAGSNVPFGNLIFVNGIAFAITGGIGSNDNTSIGASDCVVSIGYR